MKTMLAIDGSELSAFAEQVAARFPFAERPDVEVVTVCPSADLHALGADVPPVLNTMIDQCREASDTLLSETKERCTEWAQNVETVLLDGHASHEILTRIGTTHPELVIMGSHGYGVAKRFLLGSVSDRVASHAACCVLITRKHDYPDIKTIVIADDGSEKAEAAVKRFASFPLGDNRKVVLLSVLETLGTYGMDDALLASPDWKLYRQETERRLKEHVQLLQKQTPHVEAVTIQANNVADAIAASAKEHAADLVVVGSTGKSGIRKFLLGSVSQRILHHSPCSVWIERA